MTPPSAALQKNPPRLASIPPLPIYRAVVALRNWLVRLVRRLVPARVALFEQLTGVWQTEMIYVAARLGVADRLAGGPMTAAELAAATGANADALGRVMRALVAVGIFDSDRGGRFRLNRLAETLRADSPESMRDIVLFGGSAHSMAAWCRFFDVVKSGKNGYELEHGRPLFDYFAEHPEEGAIFNGAMVCLTRLEAPALARGYDWSRFSSLCDVGGGRGTLLASILSLHPKLRGVLFDDPRVVAQADELLDAWGVADRCTRAGGSFFREIPSGCDAYLFKDILHDWDDARALEILSVCRRAMSPGSKLLIAEMLIVDDAAFHPAKLLDLEMMDALHDGRQRSREDFERLFKLSNFRLNRIVALPAPTSVVEAEAI